MRRIHGPGYGPLQRIEQKVDKIMAAQDDINAAVAAIQAVGSDLLAAVQNIQAEIAALQSAGTPVDTTALDAAVGSLQQAQAAVDALETPAAPEPPAGG